jgi:prolyl 4-hydroxylase
MLNYVEEELSKQKYDKVRSICINKDKLCAFWASMDECETSASYMKVDCALACQSCDLLDVKSRCPLDPNAVDIWKPGDLNTMFQHIAYGPESSTRKIQVLSEPSFENKSENDYGPLPWVVVLDDFISDAECERLIELGYKLGYKRSKDVGDELPDGTFDAVVSQDRTSTNAWCDESCFEDEMTQVCC